MVITQEAWPDGPMRQFSDVYRSGWINMGSSRYGGNYVCGRCHKPGSGVYDCRGKYQLPRGSGSWICGACRDFLKSDDSVVHSPSS